MAAQGSAQIQAALECESADACGICNQPLDDVGFILQVIGQVVSMQATSTSAPVDASRIYMTGHSMGCTVGQRFLAAHPEVMATRPPPELEGRYSG